MSTDGAIEDGIDAAAETVGAVWPLHSFVTANPLAGFEDEPFEQALADASRHLGGEGYPSPAVFRQAWEDGRIDPTILRRELDAEGYEGTPEETLKRMERAAAPKGTDTSSATGQTDTSSATGQIETSTDSGQPAQDRVDAVVSKWLSVFLDEGQAKWPMPDRDRGFYDAFRRVARHDGEIPNASAIADLPPDPIDAIRRQLDDRPVGEWTEVFEYQLSALPGWSGFLKRRAAAEDAWQATHPISLPGYLAVRLTLVDLFDAPIDPPNAQESAGPEEESDPETPLPAVWLRAWEATYRGTVLDALCAESAGMEDSADDGAGDRPDAQLVFCIDTRSEIIRRHVEAAGDYETHGYAGFFGVPMRYDGYDSPVTVDACPPILDPEHRIGERPTQSEDRQDRHDRWTTTLATGTRALTRLRSNAATAFSLVESTGVAYGAALAARTLLPERVHEIREWCHEQVPDVHAFCDPTLERDPESDVDLPAGLTLSEQVEYAAAAFETMGWDRFARMVVFAGHASETANNPFDSSLDCGACAGNPGGPSARVLAAICNEPAVREELRERGIEVPDDTVFLAAEHNTTTDEVELFASDVPDSHAADLEQLRSDLETARAGATAERAGDMGVAEAAAADGRALSETERRAADWAETRPEWGLAGNAGFVVGPRELTSGIDLDGRAFLHSYDWQSDPGGDALEAILMGPMVVTQWINAQYYFATVDPAAFGSGSKVTQNPVGNVGVYQGNGGDLMGGLPLESLYSAHDEPYHQPLRLSTVVHAPADRVEAVLADHDEVRELLDNEWLSLTVLDPTQDHQGLAYAGNLEWEGIGGEAERMEAAPDTAVADD